MSHGIVRLVWKARLTRLFRVLKRLRKPFAVWPLISAFARPFRAWRVGTIGRARLGPRLKRPLPSWSLLVVLLLGVGSGFYASTVLNQVVAQSNSPDFTIGASPPSMTVPQGSLAAFTVLLNSLNGFAGSVNLNVSISPRIVNSTSALNPVSVSLLTGAASATLILTIPMSTSLGVYTVVIGGGGGRLSHGVNAILVVSAPPSPDFQLQASPSVMNITQGSGASSTITLTSIGGFSGLVNLSVSSSPSGGSSPVLSVNPNRVTLLSGGTASVVLTITTSGSTMRGFYTVVVQGVSGSLSNTASISVRVQ